ncbi:hypothetical protein ACJJIK_02240 [Microbulbifer sp. ZKSA006]|uniref:hypothetical protein n=1 Tax=Microbulbifer sp. ZKSA006 TaxID=3243390 RepID=UPI00403956B4
MKKIIILFFLVLLSSCGQESLVHLEGESHETIILAISPQSTIFIQGVGGPMSSQQAQVVISNLLASETNYSFVFQPFSGQNDHTTEELINFLKSNGVKSRHIAVAKTGS